MLFVAEPSVLQVSTELGRLDAGAVTAGMGLRQAVEELEWLHPDLGIGTAAARPRPDDRYGGPTF